MTDRNWSYATRALHAGMNINPGSSAVTPDICVSVNHAYKPGDAGFSSNDNPDITALPFIYGRWTNPTVRRLETRIAFLENAEEGLATASGMAAAAALFFGLLKAGDHLIVSDVCYPGVRELASQILPDFGILVTAVDMSDLSLVAKAIRPETKLIHAESPCNPILRITDLKSLAKLASDAGVLSSVDSTMATPVATRPVDLGIDFVMHSLTKYINGHGDALGGMLVGKKDAIERIRSTIGVRLGASLDPRAAAQISRGADTLTLRVKASSDNAMQVARALSAHGRVTKVVYPGLASHPQHALAKQQMEVFGAVIAFQVHNPVETAGRLAHEMEFVRYAVSLGHQHSNLCLLDTRELVASTYQLSGDGLKNYRNYAGDGVFRLSVGLEDPEDIIADITQRL